MDLEFIACLTNKKKCFYKTQTYWNTEKLVNDIMI